MVTYQQLANKMRKSQGGFSWSTALKGCPQVRGKFLKQLIITPRKPNSAKSKVGSVLLCNSKRVTMKMPGKGWRPSKYATILVSGKGHKDTPGVKYSVVRGALECPAVLKKTSRSSIYGLSRQK